MSINYSICSIRCVSKMSEALQIGNRLIGKDHPTFIIAEIGQNHQGDINVAKQLIKVAQQCGADCVKFQKTCLTEKFNKNALNRPYIGENSWGSTYGRHKKHLEFTNEEFLELETYSKKLDIMFTASAMDEKSLQFIHSIQVPFIKIGSGDSNNLFLIEKAAATHVPLAISTGMLNLEGVRNIYDCVSKFHKKFSLLHCVSAYPTPLEDVNLNVINLYKNEFPDIVVGYSGHELGIDVTLAAVALGAKIVERHITLDMGQKGSDHKCSLEPQELEALVQKIRNVELALGKPIKSFRKSELPCYEKLGKSLVTSRSLRKGHVLQLADLKIKVAEPKGLDACVSHDIIGKRVKMDLGEDESITENCLE